MTSFPQDSPFLRLLRGKLSAEEIAIVSGDAAERGCADYDGVIELVRRAAPALFEQVARNERRVRERYQDLIELPEGRIRTLLGNSAPALLAALARALIQRSYDERISSSRNSLAHAKIGLEAALALRQSNYFDHQAQCDLEAEAWIYLGNARRINADLKGADEAFQSASQNLAEGTGDRSLKAAFLHEKAPLRFRQGRIAEAIDLYDREIRLRRLIGEAAPLGVALVGRGIVGAWSSRDLSEALEFFAEAAHIVDDNDCQLLALQAIAERLARDGEGLLAWKAICSAETGVFLVQTKAHDSRIRWIKGITYRVLGEFDRAVRELQAVRSHFVSSGETFQAALVSLDLAAALAGQGRTGEIRDLAQEAYSLFASVGLGSRALAAFLVFHRAATAEKLTEALAARVSNFLARHSLDRTLAFEDDPDS